MTQTNVNIRMDEDLKRDFDALCGEMGLTMTAAFTVFARSVTKKRAIPFEILAEDAFLEDTMLDLSRVQALKALKEIQESAVKSGLSEMTLEEINAEINAARAERKTREKTR